MKLATAQAKVRSARGCSYLTHGSDDYDHKSMNKARRAMDRALVDEDHDHEPPQSQMRWVVETFIPDGDKWWLDDYYVTLVTTSFDEANQACIESDEAGNLTSDERPAPKTRLSWRDINDHDVQAWLEYRGWE